jgi:hypothetical protein
MKKIFLALVILLICANVIFSNNGKFNFKLMSTEEQPKELRRARAMKIAGIVLISTGGALDIASTVFMIWNQIDPINAPGSYYVRSIDFFVFSYDYYINYIALGLGLGGIACLAVGIPLTIIGAVKEYKLKKKQKVDNVSFLDKYTPEIGYNFAKNELILGLTIKL